MGERRVALLDRDPDVPAQEPSPRFRSSAPGTRPASASTWNPLQIPSTGPPPAANSATERMTGENRAMTPARR
jgi:hypothetical protein